MTERSAAPTASGKYFYDDKGKVSERLVAVFIQHVGFVDDRLVTKADGLRRFQEKGWVLVDTKYETVDNLPERQKSKNAERDYAHLCKDSESLARPELLLFGPHICRLLDPMLVTDGFNVLNRGRFFYFPSND